MKITTAQLTRYKMLTTLVIVFLTTTITNAFPTFHPKPLPVPSQLQAQTLPSCFPSDLPPGIIGEAVRSSIRNPSIGVFFTPPLNLLRLTGKGVIPFLNSKFTSSFDEVGKTQKTCYLTAKGRSLDLVTVGLLNAEEAWILSSPGCDLYPKLERLVFPLDEVELCRKTEDLDCVVVGSTSLEAARAVARKCGISSEFPGEKECGRVQEDTHERIILEGAPLLPPHALRGYTFLVHRADPLQTLLEKNEPRPPLKIDLAELESLRIQSGLPSQTFEMTGDEELKTSPLELHLQDYINFNKGCYLGQEGIASVLKNKRGTPRKLYRVVFEEEQNDFDDIGEGEEMVRLPTEGDELMVLGSGDGIKVGKVTSVMERNGSGEWNVYALALVRRSKAILDKMKEMGLEMPSRDDTWGGGNNVFELEGLEVIVNGTYAVGVLKSIPCDRDARNIFLPEEEFVELPVVSENSDKKYQYEEEGDTPTSANDAILTQSEEVLDDEEEMNKAVEEAQAAAIAAEEAANEANRKAEKMAMLQKRAAAAMAARKKKQ